MPGTVAQRTRRLYDAMASVYPVSTFLFHSKAHACALRHSGIRDGMRVLEVATGSGEMFRRLVRANPGGLTFGLDLSPNMAAHSLRRARQACPRAAAHCGAVDVRSLPFHRATFDLVMCCYLLELLSQEDILLTLREIRRVLRSGGRLSVVVIGENVQLFNRLYGMAGKLVPAFWGRQVESAAPVLIREAGFRLVRDASVRQGFYPSRVLVAEAPGAGAAARESVSSSIVFTPGHSEPRMLK
jgi:ubiquinone/menaquinone biosynthesis C-methylase UbiE